jgi:hypothetical protein
MKIRIALLLALLLLCIGTGAALAQTPDMLTPSRETACDLETGAAYGLCNAYCEAMDCNSESPQASASACDKVRAKFQNVTGHDVPCELPCPCSAIPEFNDTLANANSCVDLPIFLVVSPSPTVLPFPPFFPEYAGSDTPRPGDIACGYVNLTTQTNNVIPITEEQAAACVQVVRDAIASRGLTCLTFP